MRWGTSCQDWSNSQESTAENQRPVKVINQLALSSLCPSSPELYIYMILQVNADTRFRGGTRRKSSATSNLEGRQRWRQVLRMGGVRAFHCHSPFAMRLTDNGEDQEWADGIWYICRPAQARSPEQRSQGGGLFRSSRHPGAPSQDGRDDTNQQAAPH